jgi:hypothetical protein
MSHFSLKNHFRNLILPIHSYHSYTWFVVPILCPFIGALLGSWAYRLLISSAQMPEGEEMQEKNEQQKTKELEAFGSI